MKRTFRYIVLLFVFWMLVFALQRGFFLLYNAEQWQGVPAATVLLSFVKALRMDAAATAFMICLPLLFMCIALFLPRRIFPALANGITLGLLVLVLFLGLVDTGLYANWGSKINSKALYYALFPGEGVRSADAVPLGLFIPVFLAEVALCGYIYLRWLRARLLLRHGLVAPLLVSLLLLALLPLLFRGGFQKYPVGKNDVYYSRHAVLNYAALNSPWNFIYTLTHLANTDNPYRYMPEAKAQELLQEVLPPAASPTPGLLTTTRPNIVLVLLESVSAENMQRLGGREAIMPGLDSLCREGLLLSRCYASGFRTEQGLVALLSGFPAQPAVTIQREFGKFERLPSLPKTLADAGYHCNYYYSGDLNFANTSAYLYASGFSKLLDRQARPWQKTTEWGALDEEIFSTHLREAAHDPAPFFSIIMTSTSHEPFDAPVPVHFPGEEEVQHYKNTVHYTDSCLFAYIRQAQQQPWYSNTLFLISADHAHFYPKVRGKSEAERHHIPLLLLGGALKDSLRGRDIPKVCSQVDLAALLLNQLQIPSRAFRWSRDPLRAAQPGYAFYAFDNGFGFISDSASVVYDHDLGKVLETTGSAATTARLLNYGKAYLQEMYGEYLGGQGIGNRE